MNYTRAIFLISDDVRAIDCAYEADTPNREAERTTFKSLDAKIKVDDYVLVPTDTRHKMTVCQVKAVDVEADVEATADILWIIGVVDRANFEEITRQEGEAIATIKSAEKRRRRDELRKSLLVDAEAADAVKLLPIATALEAEEES